MIDSRRPDEQRPPSPGATPQEVVWTGGNAKVPYAEVHNTADGPARPGFSNAQASVHGDAEELRQKIIARLKAYMQSRIK